MKEITIHIELKTQSIVRGREKDEVGHICSNLLTENAKLNAKKIVTYRVPQTIALTWNNK